MSGQPRLVSLPDTDGELLMLLGVLEDILISLIPLEDDPEDWSPPASPLGDGTALRALRRAISELAAAERTLATQPIAPDGRFELVPVRFLTLHGGDLAVVAEALAALGGATLPGGDEFVADVLAEHAARRGQGPAELLAGAARAHGLLDLSADADTALAEVPHVRVPPSWLSSSTVVSTSSARTQNTWTRSGTSMSGSLGSRRTYIAWPSPTAMG